MYFSCFAIPKHRVLRLYYSDFVFHSNILLRILSFIKWLTKEQRNYSIFFLFKYDNSGKLNWERFVKKKNLPSCFINLFFFLQIITVIELLILLYLTISRIHSLFILKCHTTHIHTHSDSVSRKRLWRGYWRLIFFLIKTSLVAWWRYES